MALREPGRGGPAARGGGPGKVVEEKEQHGRGRGALGLVPGTGLGRQRGLRGLWGLHARPLLLCVRLASVTWGRPWESSWEWHRAQEPSRLALPQARGHGLLQTSWLCLLSGSDTVTPFGPDHLHKEHTVPRARGKEPSLPTADTGSESPAACSPSWPGLQGAPQRRPHGLLGTQGIREDCARGSCRELGSRASRSRGGRAQWPWSCAVAALWDGGTGLQGSSEQVAPGTMLLEQCS